MQWKSREKRMSECLRLQTVVLLLIHYEKTTVEEILSQMENFAVSFKARWQKQWIIFLMTGSDHFKN